MPSEEEKQNDQALPGNTDSASADSLESVLDQYLQELASGEQPDQEAYLRNHPRLADSLRGIFRTLEFIEATGRSLISSRLEEGCVLGDFRIIREVGRGGMGVVYEAVQLSLGRRVALKVMPPGAALSETARERFQREAATTGRLHHSNIVPVYAVGEEEGISYHAMQFIDGQSLGQFLKKARGGKIPADRAYFHRVARWGKQVADALSHAHQQGIIHRDIKPSNLLLDSDDNVWISDFGLARTASNVSLTVTGDIVGTARYMSPEQASGSKESIDHRTDIYSLGATLYELCARRPAYDGETRQAVLSQITFTRPVELRKINPDIPRDLETIIHKCMSSRVDDRYSTAEDVSEDLRRFLAGENILARRTPMIIKVARKVRRYPYRFAAIILLLCLLSASAMLLIHIRHIRGEQKITDAYQALLYEHNSQRAGELLDAAAHAGVDSADLYLCRGLIPLFSAQQQRAVPVLLKSYQRDPAKVETCYALAFAYYETGDYVNGTLYFNRAAALPAETALAWLLRGYASADDSGSAAIECFNKALEIKPDFTPAIEARAFARATQLLVNGDREQLQPMLQDYDAWVRFWPDNPRSYAARATGRLYAAAYCATQSDLQNKAKELQKGFRKDMALAEKLAGKPSAGLLLRWGVFDRYINDFPASAQAFREAIKLDLESADQEHAGYQYHLVIALHAMGDVRQALREIKPACEALPAFFPAHLEYALLLAESGDTDKAIQVCRDCINREMDGDGTGLAMSLAVLVLLQGDQNLQPLINEFRSRKHSEMDTGISSVTENSLAYLDGSLGADSFLNSVSIPGDKCIAGFIIGTVKLGKGDRANGLKYIHECLNSGVFNFGHYRMAQAILARAQADPDWPDWISSSKKP